MRADELWKRRVAKKIKEIETAREEERIRHEYVEAQAEMKWPKAGEHGRRGNMATPSPPPKRDDELAGGCCGGDPAGSVAMGDEVAVHLGSLRAKIEKPEEGASLSRAAWAEVASDRVGENQRQATRQMEFIDRYPQLDDGTRAWLALEDAMQGREEFVRSEVCDGVYRFDYTDPGATHFCGKGGEDNRRAWLRREMRGLVMRDTGEVVVRGLHKFFNVGQLKETKMHRLGQQRVLEVLSKLDGQMVVGVLVGDTVEYWSRKGRTVVGATATRIVEAAEGDFDGAVFDASSNGATMVFEMIGHQSRIKSNEGREPRLILTAIRENDTGKYWRHEELLEIGIAYGLEVVNRHKEMETWGIIQRISAEVEAWRGKEGVVVRMEDGAMVKVKSSWWFQAGYCRHFRDAAREWRSNEKARQMRMEGRLHTRPQRLAITRARGLQKPTDIFNVMQRAKKVEAVYNARGKLTFIIVGFVSRQEQDEAQATARLKGWTATMAYRIRTRGKVGRRIEVFYNEE